MENIVVQYVKARNFCDGPRNQPPRPTQPSVHLG